MRRLAETAWANVETTDATLVVETDRTVTADRRRLRQVFENLFRNTVGHGSTSNRPAADDAVEHGGSGVTVTVGTLDDGDGFFVADDGPGIPESERDEVFQKGYSNADDGTGFGLAIVTTAVEAHGWRVRVTESDDGGARFEVRGVDAPTVEDTEPVSQD